jgi:hypothetical protein
MMGDWRSGQELLDQADLDFATGLARAWDKFGQGVMQHMSRACRLLEAGLLRQQGQEDPASPRCIRPLHPTPPPPPSHHPAGPPACPSPASARMPARWARGPLRHLWALGYRRDALAELLDTLPPALLHPLLRALDALDRLDARRRAALRVAYAAVIAGGGGGGGAAGTAAGGAADPGGLWEAEAEAGFLSVGYDGATGGWTVVELNRRQAELMGARRGEVLGRIAAQAVPLAAPEADLLACLAHELDRPAQVRPARGRARLGSIFRLQKVYK